MFNKEYGYVSGDSAKEFMNRVYGWMSCALAITAVVAYWVSSNPVVFKTIVGSPLYIVLAIAQIGVVLFLSFRLQKMDYSTAVVSFLSYAMLSGLTFSVWFAIFTMESIHMTFAITAGMFLAMALYGYFTKSDLTSLGSYLVMGLFGLMIALFVNMWFQSPVASYYISLFGVAIFTLLTAYDVQVLKRIGQTPTIDLEMKNKMAIIGALTLYLDFINLFIYLLQLFGKRRD